MHPAGFEPMLASGGDVVDGDEWTFDAKLDGWRAVVHVNAGGVRAFSRPGRDITSALPDLAALADAVPPKTVLDGELVAGMGQASSFYRLGPLLAMSPQRRGTLITFAAFDVLAIDGVRVTSETHRERRRLLEDLDLDGTHWCTVPQWRGVELNALIMACQRHGVEGVVAKRLTSVYRPGHRSADWRKIKTPDWRTRHGPYRHRPI